MSESEALEMKERRSPWSKILELAKYDERSVVVGNVQKMYWKNLQTALNG